ncbi:GntR family transcriptional regulator [Streptomyces sp. NBC_00882]|uniref:GntR family transcriptional regulator n=1 Tax=Streptomyces TaxID=1883 RepID=UPI0038632D44|nr:GntR family transcriptional regulator [Streptomyces sp. NBC_00882]WSZ55124.1 GntR family transcriptional regulator [Streptomyces canus]
MQSISPTPESPGAADLARTDPRLPLHARLREVLAQRIRSGEWSPDEPLPAESALVAHYGVSLGTMRRVFRDLVDEGLLERRQGTGTFVRRASLDASLFRFFRFGPAGSGFPQSRILSAARQVSTPTIASALRITAGDEVLHLHRLRLFDEQPVLVEDIWLPLPLFEPLERIGPDDLGDLLYPTYERCCGQIVAAATEELTVGAATAGDALLLGCGRGEPVAIVERVARSHDDRPLEYRRSRGLAHTFRYRIDLR